MAGGYRLIDLVLFSHSKIINVMDMFVLNYLLDNKLENYFVYTEDARQEAVNIDQCINKTMPSNYD